jgi:hypothetical protein
MTTLSVPVEADRIVQVKRGSLDRFLVGIGAVTAVAFIVAGALLMWGASFADDYVHRELASQNITFPPAEALREEGRDDLVEYAGQQVTTGKQAEAYASYINGHLEGIADGKTYSEIDDRGAREAVAEAKAAGAPAEEIAELEATATKLTQQRDTLFKGETLRGLLLTSYAWSTVGAIAGYAAWAAFAAAAVVVVLCVLGVVHLRRIEHTPLS